MTRTDFLRLNQSNIYHLGIVYCPQQTKSIGQIIQGLVLIWELLEPEEMLPTFRTSKSSIIKLHQQSIKTYGLNNYVSIANKIMTAKS